MKVAVITPYHKEPLSKLKRCHDSVILQSDACTHFFVADGHPNPAVDNWECRHIVLPVEHGDNGNTPRGIGSLCAMNEDYDAICYLDADNWYSEDHVTSVLYAQSLNSSDVVFSSRHIVFPDGQIVSGEDPEDVGKTHVDTSCITIFASAYRSLAAWCQMPKELGPWCDRVMFALLTTEFACSWTEYKSVYFETMYRGHFRLAGREIPNNAKTLPPLEDDFVKRVNQCFALRSYRPCYLNAASRDDSASPV